MADIPYGKTKLSVDIPPENLLGVFSPPALEAAADQAQEVLRALEDPVGSPSLKELARGKRRAVIIASDHTRPVPSRYIIPPMLRQLRQGEPDIDIVILIATGCHRKTTPRELEAKFGKEILQTEKIVVHDAGDEEALSPLGTLPSGGGLTVNKLAAEADLLVAEGFIEPHFFAGYSGGRKSVLPGIAGRETVLANHCSEFIQSPFARTGILENNPIHADMIYAARAARLAFIVNVVINSRKEIVRAFAGGAEAAHEAGCAFLSSRCRVRVPEADIVITGNGGYPLDQNVYQCVKGMTAGEAVCRKGGVIILCAACNDGHGGEAFFNALARTASPAALWQELENIPRSRTTPDQWQYQILARILKDFHVIFVTQDYSHEKLRAMKMEPAFTLEEALERAYALTSPRARTAVIPDGVSVIAEKCPCS